MTEDSLSNRTKSERNGHHRVEDFMSVGGSLIPGIVLEKILQGQGGLINRFEWSHDGKLIASPNSNGSVTIWDAENGSKITEFRGHKDKVYCVTWSPDDQEIASAAWGSPINIGNIHQDQKRKIETDSNINAIIWMPEGNFLIAGTETDGIEYWDIESGKLVQKLDGHEGNINNLAISPNGKLFASASGDRTIIVWDIRTRQKIGRFSGFGSWAFDVAWSPDSKYLCACSWDQTLRIWNIEEENLIGICEGHEAKIQSVSFSSDGKLFASKSHDTTIRLWDSMRLTQIELFMEIKLT